jgi:nucleotide-binding universal stress UspA family protein
MTSKPTDRPDHEVDEKSQQSIRHVGVCLDRSAVGDRALPHAAALARAFGARLTVLHVLEPPHETAEATPTDPVEWEIQRTEARRHLAEIKAEYEAADLPVGIEVLEGRPAEEIRDWVSDQGVDLTVLASHGESGWTEWNLASTARKLVEGIPGSVFLVPAREIPEPPARPVAYHRILVPLDGSPRAESALPPALNVARAHGSELILFHVVPSPERACPCPLEGEDDDLDQRLIQRNAHAAEVYLENVRKHVAGNSIPARTLVAIDGDVRNEIQSRIVEDNVDLVVLSGHGRGGRAELPFGSVASFLLENAASPLLVVRSPKSRVTRKPFRSHSRTGVRLPHLAAS